MNNCIYTKKEEPQSLDYRLSHLSESKSRSYHETFCKNPYRKMIWELEKKILDDIYIRYFVDNKLKHLDFACGTGRILAHFEERASISVGVDISINMLSIAKKNSSRSETFHVDLTKKDILKNRKFNLITAFRFFPNAQSELREDSMCVLMKHLDIDGIIVFNNHKNTESLKYKISRLRRRYGYDGMSVKDVHRLIDNNGLEIVRTYSIALLPANENRSFLPIWLLRALENIFFRCPILMGLGENMVFVCKRSNCVG